MALWDKDKKEPSDETPTPAPTSPPPASTAVVEEAQVEHDVLIHHLPIRDNLDVEMKLPRDLTQKEVQRISRWLQALALAEDPPAMPGTGSAAGWKPGQTTT